MNIELITNRTSEDIDYLLQLKEKIKTNTATQQEIAEWNSNSLKGAYNYTDLNRVNSAMRYLKTVADEQGITLVFPHTLRTNWSRNEVPTTVQIQDYLDNIEAAYELIISPQISIPEAIKSLQDANDIEKILLEAEQALKNIYECYSYASDFYCGE